MFSPRGLLHRKFHKDIFPKLYRKNDLSDEGAIFENGLMLFGSSYRVGDLPARGRETSFGSQAPLPQGSVDIREFPSNLLGKIHRIDLNGAAPRDLSTQHQLTIAFINAFYITGA